jgi:hypothetical protein
MWNEVRLKGYLPPLSSTDHLSCVVLTVSEPTEAEFTLFQEGQRQIDFSLNQKYLLILLYILCF